MNAFLLSIGAILSPQLVIQLLGQMVALSFAAGLGGLVANAYNHKRGRGYDRFLVSRNELWPLSDGERYILRLRNMGEERRLSDVILDPYLRRQMVKAAKECSPEHPFLLMASEPLQLQMLKAVLNGLTRFTLQGEIEASCGGEMKETKILFAVTSSDGPKGDVRKFRINWIDEATLRRCRDPGKMEFEDGQVFHSVRAATLAKMARNYFERDGKQHHGSKQNLLTVVGHLYLKKSVL